MAAPEAMTFDSLVTDMQSYAERSDDAFVEQIPRFIMLAENDLAAKARGLGFLKIVSANMTPSNAVLAKPERWRETGDFWFQTATGIVHLKNRGYPFCRTYSAEAISGPPEYYSDYGYERFFLAPTPDQNYAFELSYFERPEPLSELNQTNWTTQYAPQLLLFGSLLKAQTWLKLPERTTEFKALYDSAMNDLANEASMRIADSAQARRAE